VQGHRIHARANGALADLAGPIHDQKQPERILFGMDAAGLARISWTALAAGYGREHVHGTGLWADRLASHPDLFTYTRRTVCRACGFSAD
jgi:hypothetical protein